jgi:hypothetical protein
VPSLSDDVPGVFFHLRRVEAEVPRLFGRAVLPRRLHPIQLATEHRRPTTGNSPELQLWGFTVEKETSPRGTAETSFVPDGTVARGILNPSTKVLGYFQANPDSRLDRAAGTALNHLMQRDGNQKSSQLGQSGVWPNIG